ncbi:MAG TPA: gliding motility-associated C-terminal domain-containing protein, partial [Saprospiraceae bacterium]|nr:gliding motility-associated C-terminal domain-containing protein [Saprospiraceae bacterium]
NDYLKILCIEDSPSSEIEIYNRWGQLVFTVKGYVNGDPARAWYGTANNEPLAEGVYFYVLNYVDPVSGNTEQKKGYVNLLR